jgi:protease II
MVIIIDWHCWLGAAVYHVAIRGDPNDKDMLSYMRSYSPYDNVVERGDYPPMLLTAGWHDSRVG